MFAASFRILLFAGTHAVRGFCIFLVLFFGGAAQADEPRWYPVNMTRGCVPFSDLYAIRPELSGKTTPNELVDAFKVNSSFAKAQPFLEYLETGLKAMEPSKDKDQQEAAYKSMRKHYTRTNAIIITWSREANGDSFLLYTEALCKSLYGASPP